MALVGIMNLDWMPEVRSLAQGVADELPEGERTFVRAYFNLPGPSEVRLWVKYTSCRNVRLRAEALTGEVANALNGARLFSPARTLHSSLEKLERSLTWTFRLPYEVDMQRAQMWAHRTPEGYTEDGIATYPARWEELYFTEEKYPLEDFASLRAPPLESRQNLVRRIHSALPQALPDSEGVSTAIADLCQDYLEFPEQYQQACEGIGTPAHPRFSFHAMTGHRYPARLRSNLTNSS
ncbi:hypothetical protein GCM10008955_00370 [Deinococcus malanensis]|uniref:Uncharacterized protein n=1 Tax=Deinococcus malanensis TaxID=1706855 RepID=A0ABQ2EJ71_9DEIO|nr:hypothetical protein GCM10008955_00370 [Deinococcus malanensis]